MNIDKFGRHLTVGITHQTNIDKFGRHISSGANDQPSHLQLGGLPLTSDGNYGVENERLCNVSTPTEDGDSANKKYVDLLLTSVVNYMLSH